MADLRKLIGEQIRLIRVAKGLTQDQVADYVAANTEKVGFDKSRISKIESGERNITLNTLQFIMKALDVSPYELFNFNKYQDPTAFHEKEELIEAHKFMLMERPLEDVQYVVKTAKDFMDRIDAIESKRK